MLNFSPASERNQAKIAERLIPLLKKKSIVDVLEIGSGSGQHALFFAAALPELNWQCTEMPENLTALRLNLADMAFSLPLSLDVSSHWPDCQVGLLYSANTLHIMGVSAVDALIRGAGNVVVEGGFLCVYGPFRYAGDFTSQSNAEFDLWLRQRDPKSGIRDFEDINRLAIEAGFTLMADYAMPANNQLLLWQKAKTGNAE